VLSSSRCSVATLWRVAAASASGVSFGGDVGGAASRAAIVACADQYESSPSDCVADGFAYVVIFKNEKAFRHTSFGRLSQGHRPAFDCH